MKSDERYIARWADVDCPNCENGGMVAQDQHGLWCLVSGCGWKVDNDNLPEGITAIEQEVGGGKVE